MKKSYPTLLATIIWAALYSQAAQAATLAEQCMLGVPVYDEPVVDGKPGDFPVNITAQGVSGEYPHAVKYDGGVDIRSGNQNLKADEVEVTQSGEETNPVRIATATGDVRYSDPQIRLKGPKAWLNLNNNDADVEKGDYQMVGRQGRGDADKMKLRGENRYTILENGVFTSCLPGNDSWSVKGSEVIIDQEEQVAEIWNARFRVANVPIFYSPYLQLPIGDKRRSGFLIPNGSYSKSSGLEFTLPYYWNIAPNYDATITPHYFSKRGLKMDNEFRYLTQFGTGTLAFDFLLDDSQYKKDKEAAGDAEWAKRDSNDRWLFYWGHSGSFAQDWWFSSDYTKVSDSRYFTDFTSAYGNSTDGYATQKLAVGIRKSNWNATVTAKQFQILTNNDNATSYRAEPQLDLNYYKNDLGVFDFRAYGQVSRFTSVGKNNPDAVRIHAEPTLSMPLSNGWASFNTEAKLMATHYDQDIPEVLKNSELEKNVTRVLPQFKADAKMIFERPMLFNDSFTQTLEPRAQYLYVPYKNQDNINNFDSTLMQSSYSGLFRDRMYSGLDRIASANQVTTGVTSRIYDDELVERFNVSVGQIYYFERPRTGDSQNTVVDEKDETGSMVWAGDSMWRYNDNWGLKGGIQYDRRLGSVSMSNATLEYRQDAERLIQLNYRYVDRDYIQAMRQHTRYGEKYVSPRNQQGISQVGIVASWPIAEQWAFVGQYYYDTKESQPASQLVGLQYNTCCWAANVGYERKIIDWKNDASEYDNKITFNIELRGMSSNYSLGSQKMLERGILPYVPAF